MSRASGSSQRPSVAIVGGGVSGLTAAYVLSGSHDVTLFEADDRWGGHTHTHHIGFSDGLERAVDSGFIVFNERTYPMLCRLFDELGIASQQSEMSLSISCDACGLEYSGGQGPRGLFAQPRNLMSPRFLKLAAQIPRFHRAARRVLASGAADAELTWGQFLARERFDDYFVRHFALPFVACVWSCAPGTAAGYPAGHLFRFLDHHGMLGIRQSPRWRTVTGGSSTYVETIVGRLDHTRIGEPVVAVERHEDDVVVRTAGGHDEQFDRVIVATHADDALGLMVDASADEKRDLDAIEYSQNDMLMHRDVGVLPTARAARSSWNYRLDACHGDPDRVLVSYWMNRLQRLDVGDDVVVTLNGAERVDPESVVASATYRHPIFTPDAVAAAQRLRGAGGPRLAFAGAHLGWGFHEDGCRSGVDAAARFGVRW
jgi:predicted NAD/FAD-binding protein